MSEKPLEHFFEKVEEKPTQPLEKTEDKVQEWLKRVRRIKKEKQSPVTNLDNAYLLSASYDGEKRLAVLKFYDLAEGSIHVWYDNTGHKPYCFTNLQPEQLMTIPRLVSNEGLDRFEVTEKLDPFTDQKKKVTKVVAHDPLSIGGKPSGSIRDIIPESRSNDPTVKVWEADIKYYENFIYDRNLEPGMPYRIREGSLAASDYTLPRGSLKGLEGIFVDETLESREYLQNWVRLLECPVPRLRYAALDIEVESPTLDKVPSPHEAMHRIICASIVTSDNGKRVLLLRRDGVKEGNTGLPKDAKIDYYDDEVLLITELLLVIMAYPIFVTFNGDDFDLRYLWHRAMRLGLPREDIPIEVGRESALLSYGIHVDLYRFFFNRSIQVYAFDQKYREITLHDVATALLGDGKIQLEKSVSELTYSELAAYCLKDSELTYRLTAFENHLVMKLMIALARIARMPMEDVCRQGVSNWIRSMTYAEHRKRNILIPTSEEILAQKGVTATKAIIKGKKYRGAVVIEPKPGVNFNVTVLDFSSLYPSIIKKWNLSYETIRCPHEECRKNLVPETSHWVCTRKQGLSSLLIGSLRDLRVKWYKARARDKSLPLETQLWYSAVQRTLKVILNAAYGVFGAEHFALYCPPAAEATASIGRYAITSTIEKAQHLGIEVIYGDTDSVFLRNPSEKQIQELIKWSKDSLGMELDVDKVYRYSVFSTRKKNYIGVYPSGNIDIKGLTGKKRNTPEFLKKAFNDMAGTLSEVKSEDEFLEAKEKIKRIVKECYVKLKNREFSVDELAFTVVLGKGLDDYDKTTPQHVKALKVLSREEQEKVGAGSIIRYLKVRKEPGVRLLSLSSIDEVDVEKYVEHIQATFEQVLDALDISFSDMVGVSRLESFIE